MIKRTFTLKSKETILPAYKALVRPLLEYCQEVWAPWLQKDIDVLEKVQERATKEITAIAHLSYEDRLKSLDLFKLADRRKRGDMITMFKIMNKDYNVKKEMFPLREPRYEQRTNERKLILSKAKTDIRKNTFSQRIGIPWNTLPKKVSESKNVDEFKRNYDFYIKHQSN